MVGSASKFKETAIMEDDAHVITSDHLLTINLIRRRNLLLTISTEMCSNLEISNMQDFLFCFDFKGISV